jgi:hypothetical protein
MNFQGIAAHCMENNETIHAAQVRESTVGLLNRHILFMVNYNACTDCPPIRRLSEEEIARTLFVRRQAMITWSGR